MDLDAGSLFASCMIGAVGAGLFVYGKKQQRAPQLIVGLILAVYPYFVPSVVPMVGIAVALLAALTFVVRQGIA